MDADPERQMKLAHVRRMSDYLLAAHDLHPVGEHGLLEEKVALTGTRNLFGHSLEQWQDEMLAVAARCSRLKNPIEHYVLSWPAGEVPTAQQAREAVNILVDVLGAAHCQTLWSVHQNTDHRHVHVMLVRVAPATGRAVELGDGWDIDRLHQAVAIIEAVQGWSVEPDALYGASGGAVFDRKTGAMVRDRAGQQCRRSRQKTTDPDFDPLLLRDIQTARDEADGWSDFHARLAASGVRYRRAGSGARILIHSLELKASAVDSELSLARLEHRFGPFQPHRDRGGGSYEEYRRAATAELTKIRATNEEARSRLKEALEAALSSVGHGPQAPALRAAIRAEYRAAVSAVDASFGTAKVLFAQNRLSHADWIAGGRPVAPAAVPLPIVILPANPAGSEHRSPPVAGFSAAHDGWRTVYRVASGDRAFTDHYVVLIIHRVDFASVEAALLLAAARWESVRVTGSHEFLRLSAEVAALHALHIVNDQGRPLHRVQPRKDKKAIVERSWEVTEPMRSRADLPATPLNPPPERAAPQNADEHVLDELLLQWSQRGRER
ncbi:relaxase/mobilization nuclease domain-containing protein [Sphingomonas oligoaromativorans]|uniref:relaxase/mobilization nuclease domain-containing protein n=1 Tax=Sphingomonas oligoaromativorans TaxID=575322 RepID=UPI00142451D0|nr:hypothetical protein [Sphingomonas oligoaromativorans]